MSDYVKIEFEDGKTKVDYNISNMAQLLSSLVVLEGITGRVTGLSTVEIREIVDDEKQHIVAKPYDDEEIIDV